ncbi:MAG: ABC transporter permease [Clostridiaceae bacterium]|nr:ABC transporter permease [Clostridiaceae bacterium]
MIKVKNRRTIANLSRKSMKANRSRNLIAVIAIALTTILFTTLFTIAGTIVNSFQQETFRQVGGDFHGTFKNVTEEQIEELTSDSLIMKSGARLMLGMPTDPPFNKAHIEVSYMDKTCALGDFCVPEHGALPEEGTNQIACDTRILKLLGVEPKIGTKIELPYYIGADAGHPQLITDTFSLSGWWTYDQACVASQAVVPLSYAEQILSGYKRQSETDLTGRWSLNVYLKSASHIENDLDTILSNCGYQSEDAQADNYVATGVNWGYAGAQFSANADLGTVIALAAMLILIILTGYLIIYNIFQISVSGDIRFYGLLKTIGTTGRQIRQIIIRQAMLLSMIGIPVGLALGFLCGNVLAPIVMSTMSYQKTFVTANPLIFIAATAFSLITVMISCRKPGKIAAKVSPVEAVRYTENSDIKKSTRQSQGRVGVLQMALANLGRGHKKTVLVVASLALAVVLFQVTCTFTNGFDMNKYLQKWVVSDFIVGNANYFQTNGVLFSKDTVVPETVISDIEKQGGLLDSGRIYGMTGMVQDFVTEDWYRQNYGQWNDADTLDAMLQQTEHTDEGLVADGIQLYGMEEYPLKQLTVIDGDLSLLHDTSKNAIAAVYLIDDYDKPETDSQWAKVGDTVTLRYVDSWELYDIRTGETVADADSVDEVYLNSRPTAYHDIDYIVAACVTMRRSMSYRYYGSPEFVLNDTVFKRDTGTKGVMTYLFNTTDETNGEMNSFLNEYTENIEPTMDYESKQSYVQEFDGFRNMFLLMGGALSFIIGLVGVLNFLNAVLTSIMARKREFAMLQSIGMTGKQLKSMLIFEGVFYAVFAAGLSLIFSLIAGPLLNVAMSSMFWFFTYRLIIWPVLAVLPIFLLLGVLLPLITYHFAGKQTIVERLREAE